MRGAGTAVLAASSLAAVVLTKGAGMADPAARQSVKEDGGRVRALLVLDDEYGANFLIEDEIPNIRSRLRDYGWDLTTAAVQEVVRPCAWGFRNAGQASFRPHPCRGGYPGGGACRGQA